jgi:hypothetical protein
VKVLRQGAEGALHDLKNSPELRDYEMLLPLKAECESYFNSLSSRDTTEVKKLSHPPAAVIEVIIAAVMPVGRP